MATNGIQILPQRYTDDAIGTLASITAIILDTVYTTGLLQNFLLKKIRCSAFLEALTADEGVIIGFCAGDLTITQIATIMNGSILGPAETNEDALAKKIYWETLRVVESLNPVYEIDQSLGGGKGIPQFEGVGWQLFAYNPAGSAQTGAVILSGTVAFYGVWM